MISRRPAELPTPLEWRLAGGRSLTLDRPRLMGILNVTPDSFSDGGAYPSAQAAIDAAAGMIEAGAAIVDVGGESTRPGAETVSAAEQIRRTLPVIEGLRRLGTARGALISIDTTRSEVAAAALDAGANIINDVSAGTDDVAMLALAAARGCGFILMHRLRRPREDVFSTQYAREPDYRGDVCRAVRDFLAQRLDAAVSAGVDRRSIVIDPGLGFGKSVAQNYALAARLGELQRELARPALSAASRKSFLARPPDTLPAFGHARTAEGGSNADAPASPQSRERLAAGLALTLSHWQSGVRLFRVHDVAAHAHALTAFAAAAADAPRGLEQIGADPG